MSWTATNNLRVSAYFSPTAANGVSQNINISHPVAETSYANGAGASAINKAWSDTRTYATGGTTLDLAALAAAATNTGAAAFTAVKCLKVTNNDATNTIIVGNAASAQFSPGLSAATTTFTIQPGGSLVFENPSAAGWTTTSANNLKIASGASTPSCTIVLLGLGT